MSRTIKMSYFLRTISFLVVANFAISSCNSCPPIPEQKAVSATKESQSSDPPETPPKAEPASVKPFRERLLKTKKCPECKLMAVNLAGENLRNADLRRANLADAYLKGAELRSSSLRDSNLVGANLRDANLAEVDLWGSDLKDADFVGARNLSIPQVKSANNWEKAKYSASFAKQLGL